MPKRKKNNTLEELSVSISQLPEDHYVLRLYITGMTARSAQAIENLRAICETNLQGRYDLEIIDIHQKPSLARGEMITAAPTLIKRLPLPIRRLVGDLSDQERVLLGLDIRPKAR